ncbi:Dihydrofolate reductase [Cystobacter fuscus DSM 2262]|uniref:Dihydrofolate reductase n=1 Tax=Cystobacter fuscus (strain ATCC 25194 / DSM 2262 / NBRC 100088 / M29) TaxID=1242864 RepID=S9QUN8_CYSF2|nr:dihydrofolate reductase [Cystobacter fuscus]EPX65034.1 Dihydrofolate reductase [Cystobacter fuscus DSM 2262]
MTLSAIVAMASNRCIGRDNTLPWRLPADLQRFKRLTLGHTLLMGRKTYESIGRPLPGRTMLVVTRQQGWAPEGIEVAHSLEEALARARGDEVFLAGGAQLYEQAMDRVRRLYLTRIDREYEGDTFFPEVDLSTWRLTAEEFHPATDTTPPFAFLTYER